SITLHIWIVYSCQADVMLIFVVIINARSWHKAARHTWGQFGYRKLLYGKPVFCTFLGLLPKVVHYLLHRP
ncbi:hypothetical protein, partial [Pantoea agglomerans]